MIEVANRLKNVEEYYFSKKLREVAFLKSQGKPIINLGIGSPDLAPPFKATMLLKDSLDDEGANKYQSYQGLPGLVLEVNDGDLTILCSKITINPKKQIEIWYWWNT